MATEDIASNNVIDSDVVSGSDPTAGAESDGKVKTTTADIRSFSEYALGGMAIVKVGQEKVPYYVHKAMLAQHSEYFDRAFKGDWKEAQEGVVTLEDIDCQTFNIFVHWLYTTKLPRKYSDWFPNLEDWDDVGHLSFQWAMLKVRVFADRFLIPSFGQIVECTFIGYIVNETCPYYEIVTYAYDYLHPESPILRAMVDSHCYFSGSDADNDSNRETEARLDLPHSFLVSVMDRYAEIVKNEVGLKISIRDYHNHSSEEDTDACDAAWGDMENDIDYHIYGAAYESDDSYESHEGDNLEDEVRDLYKS